jgi:hypothetical protein
VVSSLLTTCLTIIPRSGPSFSMIIGGIQSGTYSGIFSISASGGSLLTSPSSWVAPTGSQGPPSARDGTVFLGTANGVWMLPASAPIPVGDR